MRGLLMRMAPVMCAAAMLTGCLKAETVETEDPWVRLPAVAGRPASGYFKMHGAGKDAVLINVAADLAVRTEMHESMKGPGGTMTMTPLTRVAVPARSDVVFAPGGRHLMLFGVNPALKPGGATILTFTFSDGSRMQRKAWAIAAGDPAPK